MLNVEILEPRCLLSVTIIDNFGADATAAGYFLDFPETILGEISLNRSLKIQNVSTTEPVTIESISVNSTSFKFVPPDNLPIGIEPTKVKFIDLGFIPWKIEQVVGELTVAFDSQSFQETYKINLRGEGVEGETPFNPDKLGDLTVSDLVISSADDPMKIDPGEAIDISVTVANVGTANITWQARLDLLISDDPVGLFSKLKINELINIPTIYLSSLAVGESQTLNYTIPPDQVPKLSGVYHVIANVDPLWQIPEYRENQALDQVNYLASPELYFDVTYFVEDSSYPPGDRRIDFFNTGVGQVSEPESIYLTNLKNEPIEIKNIDISGHDYTLEMPPRAHTKWGPTFDFSRSEAVEIALGEPAVGTIVSGEIGEFNIRGQNLTIPAPDVDLFYVEALEGSYINARIQAYADEDIILGLVNVYSYHGDQILDEIDLGVTVNQFEPAITLEFPAFYTGGYYLEILGSSLADEVGYQVLVTTTANPAPKLQLSPGGARYTKTISGADLSGWGLTRLRFDADYGDVVQFELQNSLITPAGAIISALDLVTPHLYNEHGSQINLKSSTEKSIEKYEFTSFNKGAYYLYLNYLLSPDEQLNLNFTLRETDNILMLDPNKQAEIPVWFTPQQADMRQDELIMSLDTGAAAPTVINVALSGLGMSGDFTVTEVKTLNLMFPNQIQAGKPLEISSKVANVGKGDISEIPQLRFALSSDTLFHPNEDILLEPAIDLVSLFRSETYAFETAIYIPDQIEGAYYLLAVVDPEDEIPEFPLGDGVYSNVLASELHVISPNSLVVADTAANKYDAMINFGPTELGTYSIEVVSLHNRSYQPITVMNLDLISDHSFQPFGLEDPEQLPQQFVIAPRQVKNIPLVFAPSAFPPDGAAAAAGSLVFSTDENLTYTVTLTGTLKGPDLVILDDGSGKEIDMLDLDIAPVGVTGEGIIIVLVNMGNETLTVNALEFANGDNSAYSIWNMPETPFQLAPRSTSGDVMKLQVEFTPYAINKFVDTLIIRSDVPAGDHHVRLVGQGVAPKLAVYDNKGHASDDKFLPFGWHPVNQPAQATITLVNEGNYTLYIYDWHLANDNPLDFTIDQINQPDYKWDDIVLPPGFSHELTITFQAPGDGQFSDTLVIHSNDGDRALELSSLSGESTAPSLEFVYLGESVQKDAELSLGYVLLSQTSSHQFRIRNNGQVELKMQNNGVEIFGAGFWVAAPELENAPQGYLILQPGDDFLVNVRFDAQASLGQGIFRGSLKAYSSAPSLSEVILTANTVTPQIATLQTLDFGTLSPHQQARLPLTITNEGSADLVIRQWYTNDNQFQIQVPSANLANGKLIIEPNQTITADLFCRPEIFGTSHSTLTLLSNDLDDPVRNIDLSVYNPGEQIEVAPGNPRSFLDYHNQLVKVSITNGSAVFSLQNGALGGHFIDQLEFIESSQATKLDISVRGTETLIGAIISDNSLAVIKAPKVTVNESIDINGSLNRLLLGDIADDAVINVSLASAKPMIVKAAHIGDDVALNFAGNLRIFKADSFTGGSLAAAEINKLQCYGSLGYLRRYLRQGFH